MISLESYCDCEGLLREGRSIQRIQSAGKGSGLIVSDLLANEVDNVALLTGVRDLNKREMSERGSSLKSK